LGVDSTGREILSFIPGSVPAELGYFSDAQLIGAARLRRQLHDATLDCSLRNGHEVVCHGDSEPNNCVFVNGLPSAFIDFDYAHPGTRLEDFGYAAWLWVDIGNDNLPAETPGQRVAGFFKAYGSSTDNAIPSIIAAQEALAWRTRPAHVSEWVKFVHEWSTNCRAWVELNRTNLLGATVARSNNLRSRTE
jgi:aminoglycoside phosphotransferase (APT) family kinase protein